jgi:hypothetical protein
METMNAAVNAHEQSVRKSTHPIPYDISQEMYEIPYSAPPHLVILLQSLPKVAELSNGISVARKPFSKRERTT